jgi:hypothetical protein
MQYTQKLQWPCKNYVKHCFFFSCLNLNCVLQSCFTAVHRRVLGYTHACTDATRLAHYRRIALMIRVRVRGVRMTE